MLGSNASVASSFHPRGGSERLNTPYSSAKIKLLSGSAHLATEIWANSGGKSAMQLRLSTEDRKFLEEVAGRKIRPTKRQKRKPCSAWLWVKLQRTCRFALVSRKRKLRRWRINSWKRG